MGGYNDPTSGPLFNRLVNPPNPIETLGTMANALTAARNFQAQQASADAYRQSVDPQTGEVDLGKYKALMSQGPGAFNFGPLVQQGGQAVGAVGQATQADVQGKLAQLGAMGQMMFPLLRDGAASQSIDPARVQAQLDLAHKMGLVNSQQYADWSGRLQTMSPQDAYGFVLGANMGNSEAYRQLQPSMFGYGGGAINVNPMSPGGRTVPPAGVPFTPSPGEQMGYQQWIKQPYSWYDPKTLQYIQGTYEQFLQARGANPQLQWAGPPPPSQGAAAGAPEPSGKIEPPPPAAGGAAPGATAAPAPGSPAPPAPAAVTPPPNAPSAPKPGAPGTPAVIPPPETIKANVDAYNAAIADLPASQQRVFTIRQAQKALAGATTGPATQFVSTVNGFLSTWAPNLSKTIPGFDPQAQATNRAEAEKYLQQIANAGSNIGGSSTNDKLAAAVTANPSVHIPDMAAQDVLGVMAGQELLGQHITKLAQSQNIAPAAFAKFKADWMATHDPRAALPMTQKTIDYLQKTLKPGSKARQVFNDTLTELQQSGDTTTPPAGQD